MVGSAASKPHRLSITPGAVLDQNYVLPNADSGVGIQEYELAQTFTAGITGSLTDVTVLLTDCGFRGTGESFSFSAYIAPTDPSGAPLYGTRLASTTLSFPWEGDRCISRNLDISFSPAPAVVAGRLYAIVLLGPASGTHPLGRGFGWYGHVAQRSTGSYQRGRAWWYAGLPTQDFFFRTWVRPTAPRDPRCRPYIVLSTRGSGDPGGPGAPGMRLTNALRARLGAGSVFLLANPYPASGSFALVGGYLRLPGAYHNSVVAGRTWLRRQLTELRQACGTSSRLILTGYSQGAQVTGDVVQEPGLISGPLRSMMLGVVLFGDPYFNGRDTRAGRGGFRPGLAGALGRRPTFGDQHFTGGRAVISYCHANDPVCQQMTAAEALYYRLSRHNNYDQLGEPQAAANRLADLATR